MSSAVVAGTAASLAAAAIWVFLALRSPSTTYHFAPVVVTVASPYTVRAKCGRSLPGRRALVIVSAGAAISLGVAIALAWTAHLTGPTLSESGSASVEAIAFTILASAWGYRILTRRHERRRTADRRSGSGRHVRSRIRP